MFLKSLNTEKRVGTKIYFINCWTSEVHSLIAHLQISDDSFVQLFPHILLPSLILYHPEPSNENINDGNKYVLM